MNFNDKKVAILGFGIEGKDVYNFIKDKGSRIWICDKKSKEEIDLTGVKSDVNFILGDNYLNNLEQFDIVFRSPGIHFLHENIQKALNAGVKVSSATKLFFELCPAKIIGVTGTKGKGTTSTLISDILKKEFEKLNNNEYDEKSKVWLGGNIGEPLLTKLSEINKNDFVVYELSSFQLQDLDISPHIAVVLNITSDHLDVHKNNQEYIDAKKKIVANQREDDYAVINADYLTSFEFATLTKGKTCYFSRKKWVDCGAYVNSDRKIILVTDNQEQEICDTKKLQLRGEHNWENICAAVTASYLAGASINVISEVAENFRGLEHRLEYVGDIDSVKYYNDSFATGPDPTIAAIKSFNEPIILILGGRDKGLEFSGLGKTIVNSKVKAVVLIGELSSKLEKIIKNCDIDKKIEIVKVADGMEMIVKESAKLAKAGDVVLLSPAAASFDMFLSYKDRGNQFKSVVKNF